MSTQAIREALRSYEKHVSAGSYGEALVRTAAEELEAIENAAKDMTRLYAGDLSYHIRSRGNVLSETLDGHSTWEHPDVKAWSDASGLLKRIAKDAK